MPVYFFHLREGENLILDRDGRELADIEAARTIALVEARALIAEDARGGLILLDKHIDVENADGGLVHRLPFVDAIEIVWPPCGPPANAAG